MVRVRGQPGCVGGAGQNWFEATKLREPHAHAAQQVRSRETAWTAHPRGFAASGANYAASGVLQPCDGRGPAEPKNTYKGGRAGPP